MKEEKLTGKLKIAIINVETATGIRTFVDHFVRALKIYTDYDATLVHYKTTSRKKLREYDIICFPTLTFPLMLRFHKFLFLGLKVKKTLTVHGWIKQESKEAFFVTKNPLKKMVKLMAPMLYRFLFSVHFFDLVTTPTPTTKIKNKLRDAKIITNAIFLTDYNANSDSDTRSEKTVSLKFVTYSNIGGKKDRSALELIEFFIRFRTETDYNMELYIFGRLPNSFSVKCLPEYIKFKGIVDRHTFLALLKSADLFITFKSFPDLGYAEMEAGAYKIAIAKLKTNEYEELQNGINAIIADDLIDMRQRLTSFIENYPSSKTFLGNNYYFYIKENKDWAKVINEWVRCFESITG